MRARWHPQIGIGGARYTRYNSRIVRTPLAMLAAVSVAVLLALPCFAGNAATSAAGNTATSDAAGDALQQFASRIVALAGPGVATFAAGDSSAATTEQVAAFRKALEGKLLEAGVQLRQASPGQQFQANSSIRVTLGENAHGLVYLAEVQRGAETRVVIVQAPPAKVVAPVAGTMVLRRSLLATRAEPVLDAARVGAGNEARLVLLTARAAVFYRQQGGKWNEEQSVAISHEAVFPLDVRGRLVVTGEASLDAYLPGAVCSISLAGGSQTDCHDADDAWPLGGQAAFFNAGRNYFNGLLRPGFGKQLAPFYSAAALPYPGHTLWIFAGVDGQVRTQDGDREDTLDGHDWGSDLAAVHSGCGSGTQLLVTAASGEGGNDSLRSYELAQRQPVVATPAMEFDGSITALWPSSDSTAATLVLRSALRDSGVQRNVLRNPQTAYYEVFDVSIGCTR